MPYRTLPKRTFYFLALLWCDWLRCGRDFWRITATLLEGMLGGDAQTVTGCRVCSSGTWRSRRYAMHSRSRLRMFWFYENLLWRTNYIIILREQRPNISCNLKTFYQCYDSNDLTQFKAFISISRVYYCIACICSSSKACLVMLTLLKDMVDVANNSWKYTLCKPRSYVGLHTSQSAHSLRNSFITER